MKCPGSFLRQHASTHGQVRQGLGESCTSLERRWGPRAWPRDVRGDFRGPESCAFSGSCSAAKAREGKAYREGEGKPQGGDTLAGGEERKNWGTPGEQNRKRKVLKAQDGNGGGDLQPQKQAWFPQDRPVAAGGRAAWGGSGQGPREGSKSQGGQGARRAPEMDSSCAVPTVERATVGDELASSVD